jgi:PAS domain S-box-containing protein
MTDKPLAILIVEDSESDAELIVRMLEKAGYAITHERVDNTQQLKAALDRTSWDIVISDYRLPQLNAEAALRMVQETKTDLPFLIVSGSIGEEIAVAMMKAGAHDYLMKDNLARLAPAVERELAQADIRRRHRQSEKALERESMFLNAMIEAIPDSIYFKDTASRFIRANQALARLFGLSDPTEANGKSDADFFSAEHARQALADEQNIIRTGRPLVDIEEKETWPDGSETWVSSTKIPLRNGEGQIIGTCGISRSITERKRTAEALRASEERYRMLAENMSDVIWFMDMDLRILYISPSIARQTGFSLEEILALPLERQMTPDSLKRARQVIGETLVSAKPYQANPAISRSVELEIYRKDGSTFWTENIYTIIPGPDGKPANIIGTSREISDRKRAEAMTQRQLNRLAALRTIDTAIRGSLDLRLTLAIVLRETITQLGVDAARILLLNPLSQILEYAAGSGFHTEALLHARMRLGEGFAGKAALDQRVIHVPDLRSRKTDFLVLQNFSAEHFVSYFAVPLVTKGQVIGVLEVFHRKEFSPEGGLNEWQDFLETIAEQTAIAAENSKLFGNLQQSNQELALAYDDTISGWSRAMDFRTQAAEGHTQRTAELTIWLAKTMGVRDDEILHIRRGALLHNIGAAEALDIEPAGTADRPVPDAKALSQHPLFAFKILSSIPFLQKASDIPYCHHEKWDGSGYPRGLKGEQIPLAARIFAVANAWDTLTNNQPDRTAWTKDKALDFIRSQSGTAFDPQVVEMFLKSIEH